MADMSKYLKGSYITAESQGRNVDIVTITEAADGKYDKPELTFDDGRKLSLNGTNRRTIFKNYGLESDDWIGKKVKVYVGELTFNGRPQDSVLIAPVSPSTVKSKATPKSKVGGDIHRPLDDSEIPFER